jgi:hypothetical protein
LSGGVFGGPLGIAAVEDKVVEAAVMAILTPIYEAEPPQSGVFPVHTP